ncbi:hypothetical protein JCGZ_13817 [Jatropha curcas]|uniref:Uncharacterized protein n=1 Tax=Jatropha curcas TaxID=180498 RepID=A0A067KJ05_JATCU|nr:hypothetical protein JCGZ_13817 [Jatropha curcas]
MASINVMEVDLESIIDQLKKPQVHQKFSKTPGNPQQHWQRKFPRKASPPVDHFPVKTKVVRFELKFQRNQSRFFAPPPVEPSKKWMVV